MRAALMHKGAFSSRFKIGYKPSAPPLSGARTTARLNRRSLLRASESSSSFPASSSADFLAKTVVLGDQESDIAADKVAIQARFVNTKC